MRKVQPQAQDKTNHQPKDRRGQSELHKNAKIKRKEHGEHGKSYMSLLSMGLNLEEYTFEDDQIYKLDPKATDQEVVLDVTALDRYNDDIRYYRNVILHECRRFPKMGSISLTALQIVATATQRLCRLAYYGTHRSRILAGEVIPILIWLLHEEDLPYGVYAIVLRSFSELLYETLELKKEFVLHHGVKLLCQMAKNLPHHPGLSQMAAYVLSMAAIGCAEVILDARRQPDIEEIVGEMSFEYYWTDWPVNFGIILQGLLFGPNSICPNVELFAFV